MASSLPRLDLRKRERLVANGKQALVADYRFLTTWLLDASVERIWEELVHPERWPEWWPGVEVVQEVAAPGPSGVGARFANRWRSTLPYTVGFTTTVVAVEEPRLIEVVAGGELAGVGRWRLFSGDSTAVTYEWNVRTTAGWMNALALVAKPLFERNHEAIMRRGGRGLARRLGVRLVSEAV